MAQFVQHLSNSFPINSEHAAFMILIYDITKPSATVHNVICIEDKFPFYNFAPFTLFFRRQRFVILLARGYFFRYFMDVGRL